MRDSIVKNGLDPQKIVGEGLGEEDFSKLSKSKYPNKIRKPLMHGKTYGQRGKGS